MYDSICCKKKLRAKITITRHSPLSAGNNADDSVLEVIDHQCTENTYQNTCQNIKWIVNTAVYP
jgi:hypothetical protein